MKIFLLSFSAIIHFTFSFSQNITTVAGIGTAGYTGDGALATGAQLNGPGGVAVDASGNIYISEFYNHTIRKITVSTGIITTVAGTGVAGYNGDGGLATAAQLTSPNGVSIDASGNFYLSDHDNQRIRKITASTGIITTVAGIGTAGFSGDGGLATLAEMNGPSGPPAIDASGNIYIADFRNHRVRKVEASTGIITTVAGIGTAGYSGDAGLATAAQLNRPTDVCLDASGNIYIIDCNNCIRKVTVSTGIITTVAGTGVAGFSGDGGLATAAQLSVPHGLTFDAVGDMYIADWSNNRVREVTVSTGIISTVAGTGTGGYNGDSIVATTAQLYSPADVAFNSAGCLFIADFSNQRVRSVCDAALPVEFLFFNAYRDGEAMRVRCDWATASELNNDYFAVQRSTDGITFEQIGTVQGFGTSSFTHHYVFYDHEPYIGVSYYRLKQVDYNGQYDYSPIRAVYIGTLDLITIYPSPASETIQYLVASESGGEITVKVIDVLGREVINQTETITQGTNTKQLSVAQLSSGTYLLQISNGKMEQIQKQFVRGVVK